MKKVLASLFVFAIAVAGLAPVGASAQTASSTVQAQLDLIEGLTKQIQALQAQLRELMGDREEAVLEFLNSLGEGSQGEDVAALQRLLATDPSIYPEGLITGFFGPATLRAVKKFQAENGIEATGTVGPLTRGRLNQLLKDAGIKKTELRASSTVSTGTDERGCAKVPPGHFVAPGWLKKNASTTLTVPSCQTLPPGIMKLLGRSSTSTPTSTTDTTAPTISDIDEDVATDEVTIEWETNENATSKVYYRAGSSTLDLTASTTLTQSSSALVKDHEMTLNDLDEDTEYQYVVESKDAAGNTATSSQRSFMTEEEEDDE